MAYPRVLILIEWFLPGEKAGGPVRTVAALLHHLGEQLDFAILTRDRDLGDDHPYPGVVAGAWMPLANGRCRYLTPTEQAPIAMTRILRSTPHDVLYVNTLYSLAFSLLPLLLRRCGLLHTRRVIVAPRGQLNRAAMAISPVKKRAYLAAARALGVFTGVTWQATDEREAHRIRRWFGRHAHVHVAPDLRIGPAPGRGVAREERDAGSLAVAFVARISPMKNLAVALEILRGVRARIEFDVYGPLEDARYWRRCQELAASLPEGVQMRYRGILAGAAVDQVLHSYDLLLLPTRGESYGHVIAEALAAGCPPLISDRTPWRGLAELGIGWDLPLDDLDAFRAVIEECAAEDADARRRRARAAMEWMAEHDADPGAIERSAALFGATTRAPG